MSIVLTRDRGDLLHRQLFLALREQIRRGVYREGEAVPTEEQLCQSFGVSRITVRRAVADLVDEGWLERRIGRGTFVKQPALKAASDSKSTFIESLAKRSKQTQVTVLEVARRPPPPHVAEAMGLAQETDLVYASRLRTIANIPVLFVDSWVVPEHAAPLTPEALKEHPISEMLLTGGASFRYVTEEITAVAADPHVASLLKVEVGVPLLCVARLVSQDVGKPVMYLTAYMTSERSRIVFAHGEQDLAQLYEGTLVHHLADADVAARPTGMSRKANTRKLKAEPAGKPQRTA